VGVVLGGGFDVLMAYHISDFHDILCGELRVEQRLGDYEDRAGFAAQTMYHALEPRCLFTLVCVAPKGILLAEGKIVLCDQRWKSNSNTLLKATPLAISRSCIATYTDYGAVSASH
jgi:hypothetical protein